MKTYKGVEIREGIEHFTDEEIEKSIDSYFKYGAKLQEGVKAYVSEWNEPPLKYDGYKEKQFVTLELTLDIYPHTLLRKELSKLSRGGHNEDQDLSRKLREV